MKNILKISLLTVSASVLLFSSCLEETFPTNLATTEQIGESPTAIKSLLDAIPAAMVQYGNVAGGNNAWDFSLPAIHVAMESMSGDLVVTGEPGYDWFYQWGEVYALGPAYAAVALPWINYYSWIKGAHSIMLAIDEETATPTQRQYLGFVYTYRAMCYLDLVRLYEYKSHNYESNFPAGIDVTKLLGLGVPIVTENTTEAEAKNNPRAAVEDVYALIFADLDKAESLLENYRNPDAYTIGKAYIYGLKARAYLERGTAGVAGAYEQAALYARKAITERGGAPLTQEQWQDPKTGFNDATSNNSWIWGLALPSESVHNLFNYTAHMSTEESWSAYGYGVGRGINKNLYDRIPFNDFRKFSWLDPDRDVFEYQSSRPDADVHFRSRLKSYANIKFRPAQGAYSDYRVGGAADHVCMRVEEMYFIETEATAYSNLGAAKAMLNDFMKYRITDGSYDCSAIASIDEFVEELMFQKRVEFWGEGIVFFDMKRLNMSNSRGYVGTNAPANYRLNHNGRAPFWNFVIVRREPDNNPAIKEFNNPDPSGLIPLWIAP